MEQYLKWKKIRSELHETAASVKEDESTYSAADFVFNVESCRDLTSCNPNIFLTHHNSQLSYSGTSPQVLLIFETNQICVLCQV